MLENHNLNEKKPEDDIKNIIQDYKKVVEKNKEERDISTLEKQQQDSLEYGEATEKAKQFIEKIQNEIPNVKDVFEISIDSERAYTQHGYYSPGPKVYLNKESVTITLNITQPSGQKIAPRFNFNIDSTTDLQKELEEIKNAVKKYLSPHL